MEQLPAPQIGLGRRIAFGFITVAIFVVLAEALVRGWSYYLREGYERFDIASGTMILVPGSHRGGHVKINSAGFTGAELEPEGSDLWRIVSIGESTTFDGGNDQSPYPAKLKKLLESFETTSRRYDVVNAGVQGLDSSLILKRLRSKVLPLHPQVVLIWSGWNDLMKYDPVGQDRDNRWANVSRALDKLWLVKGMRKVLFFYARQYINPPQTGPESRTGQFTQFTPTYFIENLKQMIGSIREAGAIPVLLELAMVVREDMTVEDLRAGHVMFPYFTSAYAVGDFIDLVEAYNRAIRQIALEEQVPVVALDAVFQARADFRGLFFDTMHTTDPGNQLIAEAVLQVLEDRKLLGH